MTEKQFGSDAKSPSMKSKEFLPYSMSQEPTHFFWLNTLYQLQHK